VTRWPAPLVPLLDALAPLDPKAAARRARKAAIVLAIATWLLPPAPSLGTDATAHRAVLCAAFVACAVCAHFSTRDRRLLACLFATTVVAAALVLAFGHGALWGLGFAALVGAIVGATQARRRFVEAPSLAPEPDPLPPVAGGPPAFLHGAAWFGISVAFVLQFAWQATVVPTESMRPTICGAQGRTPSWTNLGGVVGLGDHLVMDRFTYLFRDPRRWEIVVFEFPLMRDTLFIKRVVGLPGEHLEIKDGDLWINGSIAKKPPLVQETMWREIFPKPSPVAKPRTIAEGFTHDEGTSGNWKRVSDDEVRCVPSAKEASFAYCNGANAFPDARMQFTAVAEQGATVFARITTRGETVAFTIGTSGLNPPDGLHVGAGNYPIPDVRVAGGVAARVELAVADGEAWALVDGKEVARATVPTDRRGRNRVEIGAQNGAVNFKDVRVDRDVVYKADEPAAWDVPKDGFFFIGDNVENSDDSRKWNVDVFRPAGGGAPIYGADEYPDAAGNPRSGRIEVKDGRYKFVDVDAIARDLPVEGTKRESRVPYPFARRNHVVGRAFMIFWPFVTPDAGFRPRLFP